MSVQLTAWAGYMLQWPWDQVQPAALCCMPSPTLFAPLSCLPLTGDLSIKGKKPLQKSISRYCTCTYLSQTDYFVGRYTISPLNSGGFSLIATGLKSSTKPCNLSRFNELSEFERGTVTGCTVARNQFVKFLSSEIFNHQLWVVLLFQVNIANELLAP